MARTLGSFVYPWDDWVNTLSKGKVLKLKIGKDFRPDSKPWNVRNTIIYGLRNRGLDISAEVDEDGQGVTARLKKPNGGK